MSGRRGDIAARIETVQSLSSVISAMRGIAAARTREAQTYLEGIRAYAATVGTGISEALALLPEERDAPPARDGQHIIVALCAEQGFAGTFSERVLDAAEAQMAGPASGLCVVGDRGLMAASARNRPVLRSEPMIAHPGQAALLAGRLTDALWSGLAEGGLARLTLVHAVPDPQSALRIETRRLVPFDFSRFPPATGRPLITLPPRELLDALVQEYVFAEFCEAITLSFAAESEARMRAMVAARNNVSNTLEELVATARRLRQEEITSEIVELASGALAQRGR
ncbi:F0F1 ATP synthase subunit gamma [Oceanicella sp. SM1341]|uniref:F0F1 ATP synthase subunit gamma n=1 Tax=Oceanicella sp. SM1341 TaxID=1548889 RepID=UPI000E488316|nr:FoF1 ATP synthase subunit gamma [Oceanicella sp. SM1341]